MLATACGTWLEQRKVQRQNLARYLLRNKKKIRRVVRQKVRVGRGHSWLPKMIGKRRQKAIPYFEKSLKMSAEHWKVMFGQTTAQMIWKIAKCLPFFSKKRS